MGITGFSIALVTRLANLQRIDIDYCMLGSRVGHRLRHFPFQRAHVGWSDALVRCRRSVLLMLSFRTIHEASPPLDLLAR